MIPGRVHHIGPGVFRRASEWDREVNWLTGPGEVPMGLPVLVWPQSPLLNLTLPSLYSPL